MSPKMENNTFTKRIGETLRSNHRDNKNSTFRQQRNAESGTDNTLPAPQYFSI